MSNVISQKPKFARGGCGGCGGDVGETDPKRSASLYHERHPVSARNSAQINGNRFPRIRIPGWRWPAGPPGLSPPLRGFPYPQAIFFLSFLLIYLYASFLRPREHPFFKVSAEIWRFGGATRSVQSLVVTGDSPGGLTLVSERVLRKLTPL